jgi:hypothetical protein
MWLALKCHIVSLKLLPRYAGKRSFRDVALEIFVNYQQASPRIEKIHPRRPTHVFSLLISITHCSYTALTTHAEPDSSPRSAPKSRECHAAFEFGVRKSLFGAAPTHTHTNEFSPCCKQKIIQREVMPVTCERFKLNELTKNSALWTNGSSQLSRR